MDQIADLQNFQIRMFFDKQTTYYNREIDVGVLTVKTVEKFQKPLNESKPMYRGGLHKSNVGKMDNLIDPDLKYYSNT